MVDVVIFFFNNKNKLNTIVGEENIDKLTAHFLKQEEENFALFSYVNELNDELEGLQIRLSQLRETIDVARALNVHRGNQQGETLEKNAKKLQEQTEIAATAEENLVEVIKIIHYKFKFNCNNFYLLLAV